MRNPRALWQVNEADHALLDDMVRYQQSKLMDLKVRHAGLHVCM